MVMGRKHKGVVALGLALALTAGGAGAAQACRVSGNAVVLTVTGPAVTAPNRPGLSDSADRFLVYRGAKFDRARAFTLDDLAALPLQSARVYSPYEDKVAPFDGPALAEVLKAAGATAAKAVTLQSIDGYEARLDAATLAADGQVLALCRDGVPLALGGLGPVFSTVPLAAGQARATEDQVNRQVWGLFHMTAE